MAVVLALAASVGPVTAACAAPPPPPPPPTVGPYFLGDSLMAWAATTFRIELARTRAGAVVDAVSCRGLVRSCAMPGSTFRPPSGLETLRAQRGKLGDLVIIELGYNDMPLRWSIDRVMHELRTQGVHRVVWVNLSERRPAYHDTNLALDAATGRWAEMRELDWRTFSATHDDWFLDGVHLTRAGKTAFIRFVTASLAHLS